MEENKKESWEGHNWHGNWHGKHFFGRWLFGLLILLIVFWIGVKIGEFKAFVRGSWYGGSPMMGGYYGNWGSGWNMPMMGPWNYYGPDSGYYGPGMMRNWPQATTTPQR